MADLRLDETPLPAQALLADPTAAPWRDVVSRADGTGQALRLRQRIGIQKAGHPTITPIAHDGADAHTITVLPDGGRSRRTSVFVRAEAAAALSAGGHWPEPRDGKPRSAFELHRDIALALAPDRELDCSGCWARTFCQGLEPAPRPPDDRILVPCGWAAGPSDLCGGEIALETVYLDLDAMLPATTR